MLTPKRAFGAITACSVLTALAVAGISKWVPKVPRYDSPVTASLAVAVCPISFLFGPARDDLETACIGFTDPEPHDRCHRMSAAQSNMEALTVVLEADPEYGEDHDAGIVMMGRLRTMVSVVQNIECGTVPKPGPVAI